MNKSHDILINGDSLEELKRLPDNFVDAIVTDPPAGISFMNKEFDSNKGGRDNWIAWLSSIMREAYRVLKPGGHGLVWSLPRTSHWTALALEDAGFEIRDNVYHVAGSGFPKSLDVRKSAIKAGLCCNCPIDDIQYLYNEKEGVYHGQEDVTSNKGLYCLQQGMDADKSLSGGAKSYMQQGMQQYTQLSEMGREASASTNGNLPTLRKTIPPEEQYINQESNLLQPFMQSKSICRSLDTSLQQHEGTQAEAAIWEKQSSMEGRRNVEEDTRELSGSEIRALSSRVQCDGAERWLCDGASSSDGSALRTPIEPNRSSTPHRPQSSEQPYKQSTTIPEQLRPQTCGRCGKAIIPPGLGSALKPAVETWWLIRKPLAEKSIAANVLAHGTGAINIDACRIETSDKTIYNHSAPSHWNIGENKAYQTGSISGRFPSHLLLSHSIFCAEECAEDCPIAEMDRQSGKRKSGARIHEIGDIETRNVYAGNNRRASYSSYEASEGGASRYFQQFAPFVYAPKASRAERNRGCEGLEAKAGGILDNRPSGDFHTRLGDGPTRPSTNNHPTVKSQQLMRYLVRLICPPNGTVLDPFGGSGSTAIAAISEDMHYILIEKEAEYCQIAASRIRYASGMEQENEAEDVA